MARWLASAGTVALLVVSASACSKTEDTSPESRIFGSPPVIENVTANTQTRTISCDGSLFAKRFWCGFGIAESSFATPFPTITLGVSYSEAFLNVQVTDAENTPTQSDILLVSASYQSANDLGAKTEVSLIVLDDGATQGQPYNQKSQFGLRCDDPSCSAGSCQRQEFAVTSSDVTQGDEIFSRRIALIVGTEGIPAGSNSANILQDCLAVPPHNIASIADTNLGTTSLEFKIEATDRSGNITEWPQQPSLTLESSSITCSGDDCACCFLFNGNPDGPYNPSDPYEGGGCRGAPGLAGAPGSGFENGLCNNL